MELAAARPTTSCSRSTSRSPSWPRCCRSLYPGVFPNLAALVAAGTARADLEAILLTGIPTGIVPGFTNYTGPVLADMLRLNTSIPPPPASRTSYGVVGGDLAGFPNGRRVFDDVVTIELRAIAGRHLPAGRQVSYTPDAAAGAVTDGLTPADVNAPLSRHVPLPRGAVQRLRPPGPVPSTPPAWPGGPRMLSRAGAGRPAPGRSAQ